jgi:hypothetical protein
LEAKPHRESLNRWLVAAACFGVLNVVFSPAWAAFRLWSRVPELWFMIDVRRGVSVLAQVQHPGAPLADTLHGAIQWRLLFPLLGRLLNLPPAVLLGLAHVGCFLVLVYLVTLLRRAAIAWWPAALATIICGATSWYFTSMGWLGYYDSWVVLALLLVAFAERCWVVWAACVWAPWVDERVVLAIPLALVCRAAYRNVRAETFDWKRETAVPVGLTLAFVVVRLAVLTHNSAPNATPGGYFSSFTPLDAPATRIAFGIWTGLRAAWVFAIAGVIFVARKNRALGWLLGVGAALLAIVGICTAQDYSRSMMLLMPVAALGAVLFLRAPLPRWPRLLPGCAAIALLLPAHHVVSEAVHPIYYLYYQLDAFKAPPAFAMPEMYELRGIREMQEGKLVPAENDLTIAIKLASNPAAAAKQRGVLRASQGRWKEAAEDFTLLAKFEPKNPDAWFMTAQAALALGDPASARAAMQTATGLAPADWVTRPDVARFQARLQQAR